MPIAPIRAPLRDGRHCVVRPFSEEDAAARLALERAIVRARHGVVKHEDELPADASAYAERLERAGLTATDSSAMCLAAEMDGGRLVGEATLLRLQPRMLRHVGVVGLGVHPEAQGLGVGRALMGRLLEWARAHRDADGGRVLRVELQVRSDNARAIALYRSLGFVLEGTRRALVRRDDGVLVDDLVMGLLLEGAHAAPDPRAAP
ncbi:GNAT family N-acetyltransferase [Sorangium sp. So ce1036]|uniref:GNAT family N-acetyltransferase n=1 Tax=Sorangium sp. So ce1036 TaxID=3133328 RepID=UPI003F01CC05